MQVPALGSWIDCSYHKDTLFCMLLEHYTVTRRELPMKSQRDTVIAFVCSKIVRILYIA